MHVTFEYFTKYWYCRIHSFNKTIWTDTWFITCYFREVICEDSMCLFKFFWFNITCFLNPKLNHIRFSTNIKNWSTTKCNCYKHNSYIFVITFWNYFSLWTFCEKSIFKFNSIWVVFSTWIENCKYLYRIFQEEIKECCKSTWIIKIHYFET